MYNIRSRSRSRPGFNLLVKGPTGSEIDPNIFRPLRYRASYIPWIDLEIHASFTRSISQYYFDYMAGLSLDFYPCAQSSIFHNPSLLIDKLPSQRSNLRGLLFDRLTGT